MGFLFAIALLWFFLPRLMRLYMGWKAQSAAERSFAMRFTIFSWVLAFVFLAAFFFLPQARYRLLLAVPIFLVGATLAKWWQTSRERLRRQAEVDENFARARRIN